MRKIQGFFWSLGFFFGGFIHLCGQESISIKSVTLRLYHSNNPQKTTPTIDVWSKVNHQKDDLPLGWKFISAKETLYLSDISNEELGRYQMLFVSIPSVWPSLAPYEREKLRGFLEKGGVLWVDFADGASASKDFYKTLPWSFDQTSDESFLIPANAPQMMPYPFKLSPFEIHELGSFNPKVIQSGNGWMILTEHISEQSQLNSSFMRWLVNALTLGFDYPNKGAASNHTYSRALDLQSPLFLSKTIKESPKHPLVTFRGRGLLVEGKRLKVYRFWHLPEIGESDLGPDPYGVQMDLLGESTELEEELSAPSCSELTGKIVLLGKSGKIYLFKLEQFENQQEIEPDKVLSISPLSTAPLAPTIHGRFAYLVSTANKDEKERSWLHILDLVQEDFLKVYDNLWTAAFNRAVTSPAVGYVEAPDGSGAMDLVACVPYDSPADKSAGVVLVWIGTKGEYIQKFDLEGNRLNFNTRASNAKQVMLAFGNQFNYYPWITYYDHSGKMHQFQAKDTTNEDSGGPLTLTLPKEINPDSIERNAGLYVDYFLAWNEGYPTAAYQKFSSLPDEERIVTVGEGALSPNGDYFIIGGKKTGDQINPTTLFAFKRSSESKFESFFRWDLYDSILLKMPDGKEISYPFPIKYNDQLITGLQFSGSPSLVRNQLYLPVTGKVGEKDLGMIFGFNAHPGPFQFSLEGTGITRSTLNLNLEQANIFNLKTTISLTVPKNQESSLKNYISLNTLCASNGCLSINAPVKVRSGARWGWVNPSAEVESEGVKPGHALGQWDPLQTVFFLEGQKMVSGLLGAGNTLYGVSRKEGENEYLLYGMNVNQSPGHYFFSDKQLLETFYVESGSRIEIATAYKTLFLSSPDQIHVLTNLHFLLSGQRGVTMINSSGEEISKLEGSLLKGKSQLFSSPLKIYPSKNMPRGSWIVDSGNNRIVQINENGQEVNVIDQFEIDSNLPWTAFNLSNSAPRQLKRPKDLRIFESEREAKNNPFSDPKAKEKWIHYLIADTENNRLIELVDRQNESGNLIQKGVLYWQSPVDFALSGATYLSVDRALRPNRVPLLAFGVHGQKDGVLLYDPETDKRLFITWFEQPLDQIQKEDEPLKEVPEKHLIHGLESATLLKIRKENQARMSLMFVDQSGAYELVTKEGVDLEQPEQILKQENWQVQWQMTDKMLKGQKIIYARRLESGNILLMTRTNESGPSVAELLLLEGTVPYQEREILKLPLNNQTNFWETIFFASVHESL